MLKLVIDSSILIDHLRGGNRWEKILSELEEGTQFFIPTIVFYELFSGKSSRNVEVARIISNLVKNFQRVELNEEISKKAGEIYRDITTGLDVPDYIIAASALVVGAEVVTLNIKHFQQIPALLLYLF